MKKQILSLLSFTFISSIFAFDWPIENIQKDFCKSDFGQNIADSISTSLIFNEPDDIKAAEDGKILLVMKDLSDDNDFFPSTLGTALIIAHEDNLASVYGNIDSETLYVSSENNYSVEKGTILGQSGNSGWQQSKSTLEFQIIDTKNTSAINPKVLLPRQETELPLTLTDICLKNKNNDYFNLNETRTYPTGIYKIYRKRNNIAVPYKSSILINGIQYDQIIYNTIIEENGKICVLGKRKYSQADVYPNKNLQLIGEVMLSPGKTTLNIIVTDFLNKSKQLSYNISVY